MMMNELQLPWLFRDACIDGHIWEYIQELLWFEGGCEPMRPCRAKYWEEILGVTEYRNAPSRQTR